MTTLAERIEEALCNCCPTDRDAILADVRELERCAWEVVHCREEETGRAISDLLTSLTKTKGSTT